MQSAAFVSGIYPFNKHAIGEEHYAPSDVHETAEEPGAISQVLQNILQNDVHQTDQESKKTSILKNPLLSLKIPERGFGFCIGLYIKYGHSSKHKTNPERSEEEK
ncbi:hypothetical protein JTB14_030117 [Gonioctena quinquepunctata]|nr:hypothetical protein JTB14_030117 [Gonioctena quinquepunctata]